MVLGPQWGGFHKSCHRGAHGRNREYLVSHLAAQMRPSAGVKAHSLAGGRAGTGPPAPASSPRAASPLLHAGPCALLLEKAERQVQTHLS